MRRECAGVPRAGQYLARGVGIVADVARYEAGGVALVLLAGSALEGVGLLFQNLLECADPRGAAECAAYVRSRRRGRRGRDGRAPRPAGSGRGGEGVVQGLGASVVLIFSHEDHLPHVADPAVLALELQSDQDLLPPARLRERSRAAAVLSVNVNIANTANLRIEDCIPASIEEDVRRAIEVCGREARVVVAVLHADARVAGVLAKEEIGPKSPRGTAATDNRGVRLQSGPSESDFRKDAEAAAQGGLRHSGVQVAAAIEGQVVFAEDHAAVGRRHEGRGSVPRVAAEVLPLAAVVERPVCAAGLALLLAVRREHLRRAGQGSGRRRGRRGSGWLRRGSGWLRGRFVGRRGRRLGGRGMERSDLGSDHCCERRDLLVRFSMQL